MARMAVQQKPSCRTCLHELWAAWFSNSAVKGWIAISCLHVLSYLVCFYDQWRTGSDAPEFYRDQWTVKQQIDCKTTLSSLLLLLLFFSPLSFVPAVSVSLLCLFVALLVFLPFLSLSHYDSITWLSSLSMSLYLVLSLFLFRSLPFSIAFHKLSTITNYDYHYCTNHYHY